MRATRDSLRTLGSARLPRLDDSRESPAQRLGVRTRAEGRAAHRVVRPNTSADQDVSCDHGAGSSDDLVGLTEIAFIVEPCTLIGVHSTAIRVYTSIPRCQGGFWPPSPPRLQTCHSDDTELFILQSLARRTAPPKWTGTMAARRPLIPGQPRRLAGRRARSSQRLAGRGM